MQYVSKISTEKSKYRPICKVGTTSEINISGADRRNSYCCIYCLNMVKTCQTETELFEFSQYELKIKKKKRCLFAMALLQVLRCNGFRFSNLPMLRNKTAIFLENGLYQKILACVQGLSNQ